MTETTTYTAAIGTDDGDYCDVTVLEDVITGYDTDDEGNEIACTATGDRVTEVTELAVRTDDPDKLVMVDHLAELALAASGWKVIGPWQIADNAMYAPAERI